MSESIAHADSTPRSRLAAACLLGLVVAIGLGWGLNEFAAKPWHRGSLVPIVVSGMAGILAAFGLLATKSALWRQRLAFGGLAFGTTMACLLGVIETTDRDMLFRKNFERWIPWFAGGGLVVWTAAYVAERFAKRRIWQFTALLAGIALATVTLQNGTYLYKSLAGERVRAWNVYHYYVGSKYFSELSYTGLYAATLAADEAWQEKKKTLKGKKLKRAKKVKDFSSIDRSRDMRDYQLKKRADIIAGFADYPMSKKRFKQLGRDTRFLRKYMGLKSPGWKDAMKDLGYNPAPPWTLFGTTIANLVPTKWPYFWLVANSDVPLYFACFFLLWWGLGLRITSAMAIWICSIQFNEARFTGGMWQYDWMVSTLVTAAFYRRGWYKSAGVALTWGAMTRVFPGFLILPFVLKAGWDAFGGLRSGGLRGAHGAIKTRHWNFLLAFTMACAVLFVASNFTGRGLKTWPEWVDKIGRHSGTHAVTSNQRVGVGRLALNKPSAKNLWAEERGGRSDKLRKAKPRKRMLQLVGLLLLIPALFRRRDLDAFALTAFAVFCAVVLSRYYASTWAVLFALGAAGLPRGSIDDPDSEPGVGPSAVGGITGFAGWFAGAVLLLMSASFFMLKGNTARYFYVNWLFYGMCVSLCVGYLVSDLRHLLKKRAA